MGLVTRTYTYVSGQKINADKHNTNENTLYTLVNGNLSTANLASNAGIVDTQLAQITTASKVAITALATTGAYTSTSGKWSFASLETDAITLGDAAIDTANGLVTQTSGGVVNGKRMSSVDTSSYSKDTVYGPAATDLFVNIYGGRTTSTTTSGFSFKTSSTNVALASMATMVSTIKESSTNQENLSVTGFVPKGWYWGVQTTNNEVTYIRVFPSGT